MVQVCEDAVLFHVVHDVPEDDVLQQLARDGGEGDRAVVGRQVTVSFFKGAGDICCKPIFRESACVNR